MVPVLDILHKLYLNWYSFLISKLVQTTNTEERLFSELVKIMIPDDGCVWVTPKPLDATEPPPEVKLPPNTLEDVFCTPNAGVFFPNSAGIDKTIHN